MNDGVAAFTQLHYFILFFLYFILYSEKLELKYNKLCIIKYTFYYVFEILNESE